MRNELRNLSNAVQCDVLFTRFGRVEAVGRDSASASALDKQENPFRA